MADLSSTNQQALSQDQVVGDVSTDKQLDLICDTKHKEEILASLQPVEQQMATLHKALEGLDTECTHIQQQCHTLETDMHNTFKHLHQVLEAREQELSSQLQQMRQHKLKSLATQRDQLELLLAQLNSCRDFVHKSVRSENEGEILASKELMLHQVKQVTTNLSPHVLEPQEHADLDFSHNITQLIQSCQQFGAVYTSKVCPAKCYIDSTGLQVAVAEETVTATVHTVDQEDRQYQGPLELSCQLVSSDGANKVTAKVQKTGKSEYDISYLPEHRGQHHLNIQVDGKHILKSPIPVSVITATPTTTIPDLSNPWGVAVNDSGQIIVAEFFNHQISIFNDNGEKAMSIGESFSGQMKFPCGVAVTATRDILVCHENQIELFSPEGKPLKCVGSRGSGPLQFSGPRSIAVHPHSKKIYVPDTNNHRVQILNSDLTFCNSFGCCGSEKGNFNHPNDITFDSTGNVYVTDKDNHRVSVFTPSGEYIRHIMGGQGENKEELSRPCGVAIDTNNVIYVTELENHRISMFTQDGEFIRCFDKMGHGPGEFNRPTGVAIDTNGKIYVAELGNGRIQVF